VYLIRVLFETTKHLVFKASKSWTQTFRVSKNFFHILLSASSASWSNGLYHWVWRIGTHCPWTVFSHITSTLELSSQVLNNLECILAEWIFSSYTGEYFSIACLPISGFCGWLSCCLHIDGKLNKWT